jgi:hypothetical protein
MRTNDATLEKHQILAHLSNGPHSELPSEQIAERRVGNLGEKRRYLLQSAAKSAELCWTRFGGLTRQVKPHQPFGWFSVDGAVYISGFLLNRYMGCS